MVRVACQVSNEVRGSLGKINKGERKTCYTIIYLLKNKDFLLLTFKLLESSLKQKQKTKNDLPKEDSYLLFQMCQQRNNLSSTMKNFNMYHQKDNSPETKLKVRIF